MSSINQPSKAVQGDVRRYLIQLQAAAAVAMPPLDAALVHDILADAEDHLLSAVAAGKDAALAIAEFGEPGEIIAAYRQAQPAANAWTGMPGVRQAAVVPRTGTAAAAAVGVPADPWEGTATPKPLDGSALARVPVLGIWFNPMAWRAVAFLIIGLVPGILYFVIVVTGFSLSLGLLPLLIGLPLLVGLLGLSRGMALAHGRTIEVMLGIRMPRRQAALVTHGRSPLLARIWLWLRDVRSWLAVAFLVGNFPVSLALFTITITLMATGLGMLLAPLAEVLFNQPMIINQTGGTVHLFGHKYVPDPVTGQVDLPTSLLLLTSLLGFVLLTGTLWLSMGAAWVYANVVKAIQVSRPVA